MSIGRKIKSGTVTQNKIPTDPPPYCANDEKHGPSVSGRKDHLCANCGKFADIQNKRAEKQRAARR